MHFQLEPDSSFREAPRGLALGTVPMHNESLNDDKGDGVRAIRPGEAGRRMQPGGAFLGFVLPRAST